MYYPVQAFDLDIFVENFDLDIEVPLAEDIIPSAGGLRFDRVPIVPLAAPACPLAPLNPPHTPPPEPKTNRRERRLRHTPPPEPKESKDDQLIATVPHDVWALPRNQFNAWEKEQSLRKSLTKRGQQRLSMIRRKYLARKYSALRRDRARLLRTSLTS